MIALTSLAASLILPSFGCHQAMTRVVVDEQSQSPSSAIKAAAENDKPPVRRRTFSDAQTAAGIDQPQPVALTARRDYVDLDSRSDRLSVLSFNMEHRDRPRELAVMADRLRTDVAETPDFMLLQEVVFERSRGKGVEDNTAAVLANELGYHCRGTKRLSDHEGVAIVSRYPFSYYAERHLASQTSRMLLGFNRVSVMGEFQVPEIGRVRVVNVHLTNWDFDARVRRNQLEETLQWIGERQRDVPADVVILGGDFNIQVDSQDLGLVYNTRVTGGIEYRDHNNADTATRKGKRIDYIFVAEPLRNNRLVYVDEQALWASGIPMTGSRDRLHLSDHLPVLQEFRVGAANASGLAAVE